MNKLFISFLECASSLQGLGYKLIRLSILIIFFWIGALKFANYEANGIVKFVANSPFMSFLMKNSDKTVEVTETRFDPSSQDSITTTKVVKEYKLNEVREGAYDAKKSKWHEENWTYTFSHGLGVMICVIGVLVFLGMFNPYLGLIGETLCIIMTIGTLSFLVTTPECWVAGTPEAFAAGESANGFPYLSAAGRLVIKDTAILAGAVVLLSQSAKQILARLKK